MGTEVHPLDVAGRQGGWGTETAATTSQAMMNATLTGPRKTAK